VQLVEGCPQASYAFCSVARSSIPADAGITIGQVFLGKYRVDAILGHGGMGVVAQCTHLGLNELVALKMLRQDVLLDRDATERFMREARAASKLRSEHVARVVDVGTFPDSQIPYMVMEFLDGHDLGDLLEQRGTIPAPWASMLVLQAAEALAEAHSIDIVHRDIKPTNLFVTWRPDGSAIVKVLDFGISKVPMGTDMQLTQTQSLLGTPAYMSPEQMRSARLVDARTDIWSLGTVMYELLEGRRPFEADSFSEMCVKVAVDAPEPMTKTPPALQQVVLRCLAKSPDQRYASMAELGRDLIPFAQDAQEATVLVERMQRVLGRRSHVDWDQGAAARTPLPTTPPPIRTRTPVIGIPETHAQHESAPARAPSEGHSEEMSGGIAVARRSRLPLILLLGFLVLGVTLGLVLTLGGGRDDAARTVEAAPEVITPPARAVLPPIVDHAVAVPPTSPPVTNPAPTNPAVKSPPVDPIATQIKHPKPNRPPVKRDPKLTVKATTKDGPKVAPKVDSPLKPLDDCPVMDRIRPGAPCSSKSH
jgi:serine/threonine-protein kinase